MGPHAGETSEEIFNRKVLDITKVGKTFWVQNSFKANPEIVQSLFKEAHENGKNIFCIFISPGTKGGAKQTKTVVAASSFSENNESWEKLPSKLSPVTGNISKNSFALVFDKLDVLNDPVQLDLWDYSEFPDTTKPILPKRGVSTICGILKNMSNHKDKIKSNLRNVVAIAKLAKPGCVWIK